MLFYPSLNKFFIMIIVVVSESNSEHRGISGNACHRTLVSSIQLDLLNSVQSNSIQLFSFISSRLNSSFIDLYPIKGIYGIYIATQLTDDPRGKRKLKTVVSFDKGGEWMNITAPARDSNGARTNCYISVSLQLSS